MVFWRYLVVHAGSCSFDREREDVQKLFGVIVYFGAGLRCLFTTAAEGVFTQIQANSCYRYDRRGYAIQYLCALGV